MICPVLALIKTLFDILLLRKGPDAIPSAPVVLLLCISLWVFSGLMLVVAHSQFSMFDLSVGLFTGVVSFIAYASLLAFFGFTSRTYSTLSAIAGCGAVAVFGFVVIYSLLQPILGPQQAYLAGYPLLLWTIPVEGYIVAKAINRPWFFGCMIALTLFFVQVFLEIALRPAPVGVA